MRITLNPIGVIEDMIEEREVYFPGERIRLDQFFEILVHRYGSNLGEHLLPEGSLSAQYFILINGTNSKLLKGFNTELKDGDEILICPILTGG